MKIRFQTMSEQSQVLHQRACIQSLCSMYSLGLRFFSVLLAFAMFFGQSIVHHVLLQTWYSADSIVCNGLWSGACCLPRVLKKWCARVVAVFAWEWFPDFLECFLWCPEVRLILACDASLKRASCFIATTVFLLGSCSPDV